MRRPLYHLSRSLFVGLSFSTAALFFTGCSHRQKVFQAPTDIVYPEEMPKIEEIEENTAVLYPERDPDDPTKARRDIQGRPLFGGVIVPNGEEGKDGEAGFFFIPFESPVALEDIRGRPLLTKKALKSAEQAYEFRAEQDRKINKALAQFYNKNAPDAGPTLANLKALTSEKQALGEPVQATISKETAEDIKRAVAEARETNRLLEEYTLFKKRVRVPEQTPTP